MLRRGEEEFESAVKIFGYSEAVLMEEGEIVLCGVIVVESGGPLEENRGQAKKTRTRWAASIVILQRERQTNRSRIRGKGVQESGEGGEGNFGARGLEFRA